MSSAFASPITAAPCLATIGRIASSRSSSPVTELTSALPSYAARPGLERLDHRGVDAERQVAEALHERDRAAHQPDLVGERVADVDVEHVGAARDLLRDVRLDLREVAGLELRLEGLAAGRVDPLADDAERLLGPDDDGLRLRPDDGVHQAGTAARLRAIRSLARRTAVEASEA